MLNLLKKISAIFSKRPFYYVLIDVYDHRYSFRTLKEAEDFRDYLAYAEQKEWGWDFDTELCVDSFSSPDSFLVKNKIYLFFAKLTDEGKSCRKPWAKNFLDHSDFLFKEVGLVESVMDVYQPYLWVYHYTPEQAQQAFDDFCSKQNP